MLKGKLSGNENILCGELNGNEKILNGELGGNEKILDGCLVGGVRLFSGQGAENLIESISVNGKKQPIEGKNVNIIVPTKASDLTDDIGYVRWNEESQSLTKDTIINTGDTLYININVNKLVSLGSLFEGIFLMAYDEKTQTVVDFFVAPHLFDKNPVIIWGYGLYSDNPVFDYHPISSLSDINSSYSIEYNGIPVKVYEDDEYPFESDYYNWTIGKDGFYQIVDGKVNYITLPTGVDQDYVDKKAEELSLSISQNTQEIEKVSNAVKDLPTKEDIANVKDELKNYVDTSVPSKTEIDDIIDEKIDEALKDIGIPSDVVNDIKEYVHKYVADSIKGKAEQSTVDEILGSIDKKIADGIEEALKEYQLPDNVATKDDIDTVKKELKDYVDNASITGVSKIVSISVNGKEQSIDNNKNVDIPVPTKTSDLTNDGDGESLFATVKELSAKEEELKKYIDNKDVNIEETDPTVPAWAKEKEKPTYKYSEIQETPTIPTYTIKKDSENNDTFTVYHLNDGTNNVGEPINVPKDMVVESGSVVTNPQGQPQGTYIELKLQNVTDPLYIDVGSLIEYVTSGSNKTDMVVIDIDDDHKVSATISDGSITEEKLEDSIQTALEKVSNIEEYAQKNVQPDWAEEDSTKDGYINNKPTIPTNVSDLNNDSKFIDEKELKNVEEKIPTNYVKVSQTVNSLTFGDTLFKGDTIEINIDKTQLLTYFLNEPIWTNIYLVNKETNNGFRFACYVKHIYTTNFPNTTYPKEKKFVIDIQVHYVEGDAKQFVLEKSIPIIIPYTYALIGSVPNVSKIVSINSEGKEIPIAEIETTYSFINTIKDIPNLYIHYTNSLKEENAGEGFIGGITARKISEEQDTLLNVKNGVEEPINNYVKVKNDKIVKIEDNVEKLIPINEETDKKIDELENKVNNANVVNIKEFVLNENNTWKTEEQLKEIAPSEDKSNYIAQKDNELYYYTYRGIAENVDIVKGNSGFYETTISGKPMYTSNQVSTVNEGTPARVDKNVKGLSAVSFDLYMTGLGDTNMYYPEIAFVVDEGTRRKIELQFTCWKNWFQLKLIRAGAGTITFANIPYSNGVFNANVKIEIKNLTFTAYINGESYSASLSQICPELTDFGDLENVYFGLRYDKTPPTWGFSNIVFEKKYWEQGYKIQDNTLYVNLEDNILYRYTKESTTTPYPNFTSLTVGADDFATVDYVDKQIGNIGEILSNINAELSKI